MKLNSVGIEIYYIHGYFRGLTIDQWITGFWGVTIWYQSISMRLPRASWDGFRPLHAFCVSCCTTWLYAMFKILDSTDISVLGFYGYIGTWILRIYRIYRRYIGGYFYMNINI